MRPHDKLCDDSISCAGPPHCPEEVRVLVLAGAHNAAVRRDYLHLDDVVQCGALHPGHWTEAANGRMPADAHARTDPVCEGSVVSMKVLVDLAKPCAPTDTDIVCSISFHVDTFHMRQVDRDVGVVREVGIGVAAALGLHCGVVVEGTLDNAGDLLGGMGPDYSPWVCVVVVDVEAADPVELVVHGTITGVGDAVPMGSADVVEAHSKRFDFAELVPHRAREASDQ